MRTLYIFIIGILLMACDQPQQGSDTQTAARCLEEAEAALANDSIRLGETLLRKAIHLAEASEDWHTYYIFLCGDKFLKPHNSSSSSIPGA